MLTIAIVAYVLIGFAYYLAIRIPEGPQGVPDFVASLVLGGFTVAVLLSITVAALVGVALYYSPTALRAIWRAI